MAIALCVILSGCGTSSDRQTRTVERLETQTGPLIVDTPMGQFTAHPVRHVSLRSTDEVERSKTQIDAPEVGQIATAIVGGSPLGPALGILGVVAAAATGWKALQITRQRNELIAGTERAKDGMDPVAWKHLTGEMEKEQNADTKYAVEKRTA